MKRPFILAVIALFSQSALSLAEPISIKGTKSAVWLNPTGGTVTGSGTDWLDFGIESTAALGWTGNPNFNTKTGSPFALGAIWLTNSASNDPPSQATFAVTLDIKKPVNEVPATFNFDAYLSRSESGVLTFSVNPGQTATWTSSKGTTYTLEMLGLSNSLPWDGSTISSLSSGVECYDNQTYAYIYGRLTTDDPGCVPQVPEPSAIVLAAIGLALIPMVRRGRLNQAIAP